jgi:hypothetical protein
VHTPLYWKLQLRWYCLGPLHVLLVLLLLAVLQVLLPGAQGLLVKPRLLLVKPRLSLVKPLVSRHYTQDLALLGC